MASEVDFLSAERGPPHDAAYRQLAERPITTRKPFDLPNQRVPELEPPDSKESERERILQAYRELVELTTKRTPERR